MQISLYIHARMYVSYPLSRFSASAPALACLMSIFVLHSKFSYFILNFRTSFVMTTIAAEKERSMISTPVSVRALGPQTAQAAAIAVTLMLALSAYAPGAGAAGMIGMPPAAVTFQTADPHEVMVAQGS